MDIFKVKPRKNKANGQFNFSLGKKQMSNSLKDILSKDKIPTLRLKFEGIE